MNLATIKNSILESPIGYAVWASHFNKPKVAAVLKVVESLGPIERTILDVGCGPGTNAGLFKDWDYTGVDINPKYIKVAAEKYPELNFVHCDATNLKVDGKKFQVVLINSILHHLSDRQCIAVLEGISPALSDGSSVIINEPLTPMKNERFKTLMMEHDRGDYFRTGDEWRNLFASCGFNIRSEDWYVMKLARLFVGWNMYCALLSK